MKNVGLMRTAYCLTHPIQYQSPLIRHLRVGGIDLEVVYASDATSRSYFDPGFGARIAWDLPLLDGYPHVILNQEPPGGGHWSQVAHYRRQLRRHLADHSCGAVWVHGWSHPYTKAAWAVAKELRLPLLLRGETFPGCVRGGGLRRFAHRFVLSRRFRQVAAFLAVGTLNHQLYRDYGVPESRIFGMPYAVDNAFFRARAMEARAGREALRMQLGLPPGVPVILFCGKLIDVKDPATLVRAAGRVGGALAVLMVGDGALREELEALARRVAPGRVQFLGFHNQTELPALYDLCDVFVLPSVFEPWGLVVNEVMNAGKPVIVSDEVGAGADLVRPGVNGGIFKPGDAEDLQRVLEPYLNDPLLREKAGRESLRIIDQWGFDQCLEGMRQALAFVASQRA